MDRELDVGGPRKVGVPVRNGDCMLDGAGPPKVFSEANLFGAD